VASPILVHLDFISPYADLAWTQIHALAAKYERAVEPVPTLLAALLGHSGTLGPGEIPAKRIYTFKDVLRTAKVLGVPLAPPPSHPFNPLVALRVAGLPMDAAVRKRLIDALYVATWGGGGGVETPDKVAAVATSVGLDGAALVELASQPEAKEHLKRVTAEAIEANVFGVPTMRVDGELFWGFDSFAHLERCLRGEDPLRSLDLASFRDIRPSASRK
jgi:2-hydroxychromene-2-carboxylate isomerase